MLSQPPPRPVQGQPRVASLQFPPPAPAERPRLVLVDDDPHFPHVAAQALGRRGFDAAVAHDAASALALADRNTGYAVVDLVLGGESGLALLPRLKALNPAMRILVLTGCASIGTAVEAIKRGAANSLAKPVDADTIAAALAPAGSPTAADVPASPISLRRLKSAHLRRVLVDCGGNISAASRVLKMHRRTLQRKLGKR